MGQFSAQFEAIQSAERLKKEKAAARSLEERPPRLPAIQYVLR
jgi:hypothetical protein